MVQRARLQDMIFFILVFIFKGQIMVVYNYRVQCGVSIYVYLME